MHASLHARWIMGGAGVNPVHALTKARIFASLLQWEKVARFTAADEVLPCVYCQQTYFTMFAPRHAPNSNREVRHSPTWHSSESESALERFEPVAVVQQLPDGRGTVFAPVAARRQKEFKRGKRSSFCPFRSFRTSEKNSEREET